MKGRPIDSRKLLAVPQAVVFILLTTACFTIVVDDGPQSEEGGGRVYQTSGAANSSFSPAQPQAYALTIDGAQVSSETVSVANGSVGVSPTPNAPSGLYANGTIVTLAATPHAGYALLKWSGDCSSATGDVCTLAMDINRSVNVTFRSASVSTIR